MPNPFRGSKLDKFIHDRPFLCFVIVAVIILIVMAGVFSCNNGTYTESLDDDVSTTRSA